MADVAELATQLVERFDRNRDSCLTGGINVIPLRRELRRDLIMLKMHEDLPKDPHRVRQDRPCEG